MGGIVLFIGFCVLVWWLYRRFKFEQGSTTEDPPGDGGGPGRGGPKPDFDLPPLPHGTGPTLRHVPDEWVEEFKHILPRRLEKVPDLVGPKKKGK